MDDDLSRRHGNSPCFSFTRPERSDFTSLPFKIPRAPGEGVKFHECARVFLGTWMAESTAIGR